MELQMNFNEIMRRDKLLLEEQDENKRNSYLEFVSEIDKAKKDDYMMREKLYEQILKYDNPKVYLHLISGMYEFNHSLDSLHENVNGLVHIDYQLIFKSLLHSKDVVCISLALNYLHDIYMYHTGVINHDDFVLGYEALSKKYILESEYVSSMCIKLTFNYMIKCKDNDFFASIINRLDFDISGYINYILSYILLNDISDEFIWNNITGLRKLNSKAINKLFEKRFSLGIMYMISNNLVTSKNFNRVKTLLSYPQIREDIKSIDVDFYNELIIPILKNIKSSQSKKDMELVIDDYFSDEEESYQYSLFPSSDVSKFDGEDGKPKVISYKPKNGDED